MLASQNDWFNEIAERNNEKEWILELDEASFSAFLKSDLSENQISAALKKIVLLGKMEYWSDFERLNSNKDIVNRLWNIKEGLEEIKRTKEINEKLYEKIYESALQELRCADWPDSELLDIMLLINPALSVAEFNKSEWHEFKKNSFIEIIEGLNRHNLSINEDTIVSLFEKAESSPHLKKVPDILANLIVMMKNSGMPKAETLAYKYITDQRMDSEASSMLANVICSCHGVESVDEYMLEKYKEEIKLSFPYEKGDDLYKAWVSLGSLDGQVRNGGFEQFFSNDYGYQFLDAVKYSGIIKDKKVHALLLEVKEELAAHKLVDDYSCDEFAKIYLKVEDKFQSFDNCYYEIANNLDARLLLYIASKLVGEDLLKPLSK